jgi:predicted house-cleaning noncanonical NTP pyrophosphatase (MazG superfamily)
LLKGYDITMKYNKLVRDKIPEIIRHDGKKAIIHTAEPSEYQRKLYEKVREEIKEFTEKPSAEEFADILEVLDALAALHSINRKDAEKIQKTKAAKRGRFKKRIILEEIQ